MPKNASSASVWFLVSASAWFFWLSATAWATDDRKLRKQLQTTIAKIRNGDTIKSRLEAAEHLESLTEGIDPRTVDDTTLREVVSLLDIQEARVRVWVVGSLGNLGPRAKVAVPRLLGLLREEDCIPGTVTVAQ